MSLNLFFLLGLVSVLAGCGTNSAAQAGGTDDAGYGRIKIGVPF